MFKVTVYGKFSSAHFLRNYNGKCENMHGHNYKVEISVVAKKLDDSEMVVDFTIIKNNLKEILDELDHKLLNELEFFKIHNPTSENIAYYIFMRIKEMLDKRIENKNIKLISAKVWETDEQYAEYFENL